MFETLNSCRRKLVCANIMPNVGKNLSWCALLPNFKMNQKRKLVSSQIRSVHFPHLRGQLSGVATSQIHSFLSIFWRRASPMEYNSVPLGRVYSRVSLSVWLLAVIWLVFTDKIRLTGREMLDRTVDHVIGPGGRLCVKFWPVCSATLPSSLHCLGSAVWVVPCSVVMQDFRTSLFSDCSLMKTVTSTKNSWCAALPIRKRKIKSIQRQVRTESIAVYCCKRFKKPFVRVPDPKRGQEMKFRSESPATFVSLL